MHKHKTDLQSYLTDNSLAIASTTVINTLGHYLILQVLLPQSFVYICQTVRTQWKHI